MSILIRILWYYTHNAIMKRNVYATAFSSGGMPCESPDFSDFTDLIEGSPGSLDILLVALRSPILGGWGGSTSAAPGERGNNTLSSPCVQAKKSRQRPPCTPRTPGLETVDLCAETLDPVHQGLGDHPPMAFQALQAFPVLNADGHGRKHGMFEWWSKPAHPRSSSGSCCSCFFFSPVPIVVL